MFEYLKVKGITQRAILRGIYGSLVLLSVGALVSCTSSTPEDDHLFTLLPADETNVRFENQLEYNRDFNIYRYRNFYNGGGVGIGDVNNDGWPDLYLTANMTSNKLFLNRGDTLTTSFSFDDVTDAAGVGGERAWSTGVSMVDINADGWLDIYVCNSGDVAGDNKQNEFFINQGDGTFRDQADAMGLADEGYSTHAAFFDYDKDGDLDVYLLNNSYRAIGSFNLRTNERPIRDELGGDKLLRNDTPPDAYHGKDTPMMFTDVSEEAGIYGSEIGFGLGVSVSDLDRDGWLDLYISNDFFEKDYIYMNNGDGTFSEELESQMPSISVASMGSDIADLNGDGYPEVFVTEMLPEGDRRFKTTMTFENWDKYQFNLAHGYYHQFTRNMLHRNNGVVPGKGVKFSEVGRMADVEATDWSWSALLADFDNDGWKDLFVANGVAKDILDQDYLRYVSSEEAQRMVVQKEGVDFKQLIDIIPTNRIPNYAFRGGPELSFANRTEEWGLATPSHSNGAAYGDLDNDGDLDLVVNNVNMPVFVYENTQPNDSNANYLKLVLRGEQPNSNGVGAKVSLIAAGNLWYQEQYPNRGFQSSVDPRLNFGLGSVARIDTLKVEWYGGSVSLLTNVPTNQTLEISESDASAPLPTPDGSDTPVPTYLAEVEVASLQTIAHRENKFVDFDRDRLLYHMQSTEGPHLSVADVNGDGLEDVYLGGAKDSPGTLLIQQSSGKFIPTNKALFEKDKTSEDMRSLFFDADGDDDLDLYVTSGGSELPNSSFGLVDRLYLNDGRGNFTKSEQILPAGKPESTSVVEASDFDGDGDLDLFVGVRLRSNLPGVPQSSYLLENDGRGNFTNVTDAWAPALHEVGLVTDALWSDYDRDGDEDLLLVGEWMNIRLFRHEQGRFEEQTEAAGLQATSGWWNTVETADFNQDGRPDFIVGNHGLNSRFRASAQKPISCYINDFDRNGSIEQIICQYNGDTAYPMVLRHDLVMELPGLKKKYLKYEDYQQQTIRQIFTEEQLANSVIHEVTMLESVVLMSNADQGFDIMALPTEAQLSPIYAIRVDDLDQDGYPDVLAGGNLYEVKPEVGRYDASYGLFLKGTASGEFSVVPPAKSGWWLEGQVRDLNWVQTAADSLLLVGRNNDTLQIFRVNEPAI